MDFVGSIVLTLQYLEIVAWSSFALVYPLCASVQAMESKSRKDMRKLMAYWIIFSLLMLFEIALGNIVRLIIPLWSCIKLLTVCWFGLPHFERADIFYCNLIVPFLSELRTSIIHYLCKPMEEIVLTEECFLALVEKFVDLNGSEALEELVARKTSLLQKKPNVEDLNVEPKVECKGNIISESVVQANAKHGNVKPERNIQREENVATMQASLLKKPDVEDLKAEQKEVNKGSIEPVVHQCDSKSEENMKSERNIGREENVPTIKKPDVENAEVEQKEESKGSIEPVREVFANLLHKLQPATVVKEAAEGDLAQTPKGKCKNVLVTCTTCQVTVNEKIMQSHLRGKKHIANMEKEMIIKFAG